MKDETFDEAIKRKADAIYDAMTDSDREAVFRKYVEGEVRAALEEYRDELLALDRALTSEEARTLRNLNYTLSTVPGGA